MTAAQAGDRRALDRLLRRHYDYIFAICRRLCGNDADAADATQDAMISIVRGLPRYDGRAAFTTWSYRIATNACLDELRRRKRRPAVEWPEHEHEPAGHAPRLDEQVSDRVTIGEAIDRLPPEFRTVIVLRDQLGLDYAEIAEVVGIPPGTVRSRISRGRTALAALVTGPPTVVAAPRSDHDTGNQPPATAVTSPIPPPAPDGWAPPSA